MWTYGLTKNRTNNSVALQTTTHQHRRHGNGSFWISVGYSADQCSIPRAHVATEMEPSFIAKLNKPCESCSGMHTNEGTTSQNSVLLRDLRRSLWATVVLCRGSWSTFVAFRTDDADTPIRCTVFGTVFSLALISSSFSQLSRLVWVFSSCQEWNLLPETFSLISNLLLCLEHGRHKKFLLNLRRHFLYERYLG